MNVNQYKEILHQKDKKIIELERQIKLYKDKLKNQITLININSSASLNNFNLNKTQSSKNVIERNLGQIRSYSSSHTKIKTSSPMANNIYRNKNKFKKMNVNQYKEILHQKDKKIVELERQIKIYKDKLKNQITLININSSASLNNFNLNKTQSTKNVIERNLGQIRSYSSSYAKIKTSSPMSNNICRNKNKDTNDNYNNNKINNNKNRYKKRPKSNDYKKEKINNLFFVKNLNEIKKQHYNYFKNKSKSKNKNENIGNYKRAKSSNTEKIRNINNNITKPKMNINNKSNELLSIEETKYICEKMLEKLKKVLELVKITTTSEN
jgi:hypothetical protein